LFGDIGFVPLKITTTNRPPKKAFLKFRFSFENSVYWGNNSFHKLRLAGECLGNITGSWRIRERLHQFPTERRLGIFEVPDDLVMEVAA
jgi:hypothetical protein